MDTQSVKPWYEREDVPQEIRALATLPDSGPRWETWGDVPEIFKNALLNRPFDSREFAVRNIGAGVSICEALAQIADSALQLERIQAAAERTLANAMAAEAGKPAN